MTRPAPQPQIALGLLLAAFATSASSQPKGPQSPAAIQRGLECRKVTPDAARLACYDAAIDEIAKGLDKGDMVVVDREQARKVRRQAFGFSLPSLSLFERGEKPEELNRVTLPIERAMRGGDGKWVVQVDGQVWRQVDSEQFSREPREGRSATIRRAMMGSYMMSVDGHPGGRVTRDK